MVRVVVVAQETLDAWGGVGIYELGMRVIY